MEAGPDLYDERYYINRELSWLEFNRRCLQQAEDETNPILERAKFLAICCGNMDRYEQERNTKRDLKHESLSVGSSPRNISAG